MTKKEFESLDAFEKLEALQSFIGSEDTLERVFDYFGYWKMHDALSSIFDELLKEDEERRAKNED